LNGDVLEQILCYGKIKFVVESKMVISVLNIVNYIKSQRYTV